MLIKIQTTQLKVKLLTHYPGVTIVYSLVFIIYSVL